MRDVVTPDPNRPVTTCRHGHRTDITPCGRCECPAGGRHTWAEQDSGDAYGPLGGGPGCLAMILFSVIASVLLTVLLNLLIR